MNSASSHATRPKMHRFQSSRRPKPAAPTAPATWGEYSAQKQADDNNTNNNASNAITTTASAAAPHKINIGNAEVAHAVAPDWETMEPHERLNYLEKQQHNLKAAVQDAQNAASGTTAPSAAVDVVLSSSITISESTTTTTNAPPTQQQSRKSSFWTPTAFKVKESTTTATTPENMDNNSTNKDVNLPRFSMAEHSAYDFDDESVYSRATTVAPTTPKDLWRKWKGCCRRTNSNTRSFLSEIFQRRFRQTIGILLSYTAIILPIVVCIYLRNQQVERLENRFDAMAQQIVRSFPDKLQTILTTMNSISLSSETSRTASWPITTLWDFGLMAESALAMSNTVFMAFHPHVTDVEEWQQYSVQNGDWIHANRNLVSVPYRPFLWQIDDNAISAFQPIEPDQASSYFPIWQLYPFDSQWINNCDIISEIEDRTPRLVTQDKPILHELYERVLRDHTKNPDYEYAGEPVHWMYYPIYDREDNHVGVLSTMLYWPTFVGNILKQSNSHDDDTVSVYCVVESTECDTVFTLEIFGNGHVSFKGHKDLHDRGYNDMVQSLPLISPDMNISSDCSYTIRVYPTDSFQSEYMSLMPYYFAISIFILLLVLYALLAGYDATVRKKMDQILAASSENQAIVTQMFPDQFRPTLLLNTNNTINTNTLTASSNNNLISAAAKGMALADPMVHPKARIKNFLEDGESEETLATLLQSAPIADLFPNCTVCFADVSGFDAWSSGRGPEAVFTLLEVIFRTIDNLARRRSVFKVETIADCYVAVTGLPDPQTDHASRMARFARDCMAHVHQHIRLLGSTLGGDTEHLRLRIGMNSGPVTAGVLKGEKSRFQLFGDTMNTASRMQSTGKKNRIQLSESTADLLKGGGKESWLQLREDAIVAKGKGTMVTYWLTGSAQNRMDSQPHIKKNLYSTSSMAGSRTIPEESIQPVAADVVIVDSAAAGAADASGTTNTLPPNNGTLVQPRSSSMPYNVVQDKSSRTAEWLSDLLEEQIREIVAERRSMKNTKKITFDLEGSTSSRKFDQGAKDGGAIMDEIAHSFPMPLRCNAMTGIQVNESVQLPLGVKVQLRKYVSNICRLYQNNPFHSLDHCAHVTMSVVKLMKRIGSTDIGDPSQIHEMTYGIASNALLRFAVVFAAVVHDVDHPGVPNGQLVKEGSPLAAQHRHQCILEQNSINIAWTLLMQAEYKDLVNCICATESDRQNLRTYVVNLVLATDLFNPRLKNHRNERWDAAFSPGDFGEDAGSGAVRKPRNQDELELRAAVIVENLIQAADISPTMQSWTIYQKWNERLFREMYQAYKAGRSERDPSVGWFYGELWFFDNYAIPIAQKLYESGAFGPSSSECLTYARNNRREWETNGQEMVREMVKRVSAKTG